MPYSPAGKQLDFPRTQTAPTVASQVNEADAVNETDFDGETYSVSKKLIAGQNDLSLQAFEFSQPGMDEVIMRELVKAYNAELDRQLLEGTGSSGQHLGIRAVSGINTQTFSSGGADDLLGKIYAGLSDISTNAPGYFGNAVVLHPRRASWIASHRDSLSNLLQQGSLVMAAGTQDRGFAGTLAGVGAIIDPNIATNRGASTNEDELYLVSLDELLLAEGPVRARVLSEVLSGTLQVRLQLFAFSAFAGGRRSKVITKVSGAGLATPTFPSS
jgi:HK97 family phage major capsid protein